MNQFAAVAGAHFLALLSPGPDFFLIAHSSMATGWRRAAAACAGIAAANAVFIAAAFAGLSILRPGTLAFTAVQIAGAGFLVYLGTRFLRSAGSTAIESAPPGVPVRTAARWWKLAVTGFASAALNPKNALFYASLAAVLVAGTSAGHLAGYGIWMVTVVLLWDLLIAVLIGNQVVLTRFARALPLLERASGVALIALGAGILLVAVMR
ncbi:LysE family translocator [Nocardia vermiculata]|uniref:LysE family transporter n=1 Tax=Nocardia vermiculata TaxID=257274 RepID=A0A846Y9F6_9NOCA|nr:LysE family transporter [Nocardia vermiculata]NKY54450.1 LysE family transporter [Nocardia vermiculata]